MKYLPLLLLCLCLSCGDSGDGSSSESTDETSSSMTEGTNSATSGGSSCLAQWNQSPCELFSVDEMAALLEVNPEELEQKAIERIAYDNKDLCNYSYDRGRKSIIKVAGKEMEMPVKNTVIIGQINVLEEDDMKYDDTYMAFFNKRYGKRTEEQKKAISESIDRAAESSDDVEKEQAETIKKMAEAQQFEMVEGAWDAASYDIIKINNQLNFYVLHKNVVFRVEVNISNDTPDNLAMAQKIATRIIEKCNI